MVNGDFSIGHCLFSLPIKKPAVTITNKESLCRPSLKFESGLSWTRTQAQTKWSMEIFLLAIFYFHYQSKNRLQLSPIRRACALRVNSATLFTSHCFCFSHNFSSHLDKPRAPKKRETCKSFHKLCNT